METLNRIRCTCSCHEPGNRMIHIAACCKDGWIEVPVFNKPKIMEKSYYIPEVEELYIGFECEIKTQENIAKALSKSIESKIMFGKEIQINDDELYETHIINARDIQMYSLNPHIFKLEIRVKYLDQEDIESLGFKQIANDCFNISNIDYRGKTNCDLRLLVRETILIYIIDTEENIYTLFTGHIKNKSELSKLMKQLKIMK